MENSFCFICLELVSSNLVVEQLNHLNFLLSYLKIRAKVKPVVCERCGEKLAKFVKLCKNLEKVRLEMDYLLEFIQSAILNSNKLIKPASGGFDSVRECVMKRCREKMLNPRLEIRLERTDILKRIYEDKTPDPDSSDDWSPALEEDEFDSNSIDSIPRNSNRLFRSSTTPACELVDVKIETDLEEAVKITKRNPKYPTSATTTKCSKCSMTFRFKTNLYYHNKTVHLRLKPFRCSTCFMSFGRRQTLENHVNSVHLRLKPFNCPKCPSSFAGKAALRKHIDEVHLRLKPFKCDCGKSFTNKNAFKIHKAKPHKPKPEESEIAQCDLCEKSFDNSKLLQKHKRFVHKEERFQCDICKKTYKGHNYLKNHIAAVHQKKRHSCQAPGCGKSYSQKAVLVDHYKLKHPDFAIPKTPRPPKGADLSDKFKVTTEEGDKVFECLLCPKKYKLMTSIRHHLLYGHGQKKFVCEMCGYRTTLQAYLNDHIKRMHSEDIVKVECEFCKKLVNSLNYGAHIRNVHRPKKLVCEICGYVTANKGNLDVHVERIHSDKISKTVECELCNKKVNHLYIYRHKQLVHGEKKFKCQSCDYATASKQHLERHVRQVHKQKV